MWRIHRPFPDSSEARARTGRRNESQRLYLSADDAPTRAAAASAERLWRSSLQLTLPHAAVRRILPVAAAHYLTWAIGNACWHATLAPPSSAARSARFRGHPQGPNEVSDHGPLR